ncbi:nuclease-related domain-containing protein [Bacillus sp. T33-2]|uniref:nuclease-related domain-containing protein n=1 Tax=Bacillus sp. T33-2 TaxID=2054168 RepID=UPI000C77913E|nr:nuclease-related domain-containing protein [Bacillus sp. T33-2]PLR98182.1 nuclease [Bacillus sp. T33-2]
MLKKPRSEPAEIKILTYLNTRMELPENDKQNYLFLKKGYEGEVLFDSLTEKLQCECFIINDLLLEMNNTMFQIDSLIVSQNTIYLFEIKNYEGDFYYERDRLYTKTQSEIKNPLLQLKRSESLLRQLLQKLGFPFPIEAWVVFINPEFTLYQAPLNEPIIFPSQLNRFMKKVNTTQSKLNGQHWKIAEKLTSLHIEESPYNRLPAYEYNQLRKGITCKVCHSFFVSVRSKKCVCDVCEHEEAVDCAVLRSVEECKLLFPGSNITTNLIHEWCKVIETKKKINRILHSHLKIEGVRQWAYFK